MSAEDDYTSLYEQRKSAVGSERDKAQALKISLSNPPVGSKSQELKELNCQLVSGAIGAISDGDIDSTIKGLALEDLDVLMKYIYKILADKDDCSRSGQMLKWHAKVLEVSGQGGIVRVMTDRKTV